MSDQIAMDGVVGDVLRDRRFVQMAPDLPVSEAAKRMARKKVSAVLVVQAGQLVGILTEKDIVHRVVAGGLDIDTTKLSRVMTRNPVSVTPDTSVRKALGAMRELQVRHLPVALKDAGPDEDPVVGVLAELDVLQGD